MISATNWMICELWMAGVSGSRIAQIVGLPPHAIYTRRCRLGLPKRASWGGEPRGHYPMIEKWRAWRNEKYGQTERKHADMRQLVRALLNEGESRGDISRYLDVSIAMVDRYASE